MFKKVLLPTDFSAISWNAIAYAIRLFEDQTCRFYLLNSTLLKVSTTTSFSNRLSRTLYESAMTELNKWVDKIKEQNINPEHEFEILISEDHLDHSIEWAVEKFNIDLVVMATKGATAAKGAIFGSNTVRVIKHAGGFPVLIIPEDCSFKKPEAIAFPTDFERSYSTRELKPLKTIAQMFNSQIRILHINEEEQLNDLQEINKAELTKFLEPCQYRFHWMPDYAKKAEEIHVFIETMYVDMLAMVKYKHSVLESIFNEPVIKKISFKTEVPFLVIPE
ncbi:MAG: universal stress protein [Flavobacteriaceae bacterium]|nr:universal stress protein [Flavobacteriaceae bacterium]